MKVYLVGDYGPEHYNVKSVHRTKTGALKAWNRHRLYLLQDAKNSLKNHKNDKYYKDMLKEMIRNLSCKDPKKIDNGTQETPFIEEKEIEE
ncbi:MAG: hypothetical protein NT120_04345 [Candidatus Aenigmarchaeota archaeon]|nr:hypothetical protein [Candidatus Aenigmarchaeota archaeon]